MSPGTVVVTEGAVGNVLPLAKAPLCESMGVVRSTFLKSRIAPVAEEAEASDHSYARWLGGAGDLVVERLGQQAESWRESCRV